MYLYSSIQTHLIQLVGRGGMQSSRQVILIVTQK